MHGLRSFCLLSTLYMGSCYVPTRIRNYKISGNFYKRYENIEKACPYDNHCLFYTGGSSFIPGELYDSFLTKVAEKNITVTVVNKEIKDQYIILKSLTDNKPITVVGHSSGAIEALRACDHLDNVKNVILLDPVDTRFVFDKNNKNKDKVIEPRYEVDDILFLNAQKSYEWRVFPFRIPFIPAFALTKDSVVFKNKKFITAKDFGHCDVLDYPWGKIMHETLSEGLDDRDQHKIDNYHEWLSSVISVYIKDNELNVTRDIEYSTN